MKNRSSLRGGNPSKAEAIYDLRLLRALRALAMTVLYLFFISSTFSLAEEIPERVDARVISVDSKSRILKVDFEHPATFERSQLEFQVAEDAGFKDFKKLSDLKEGDLVSLDYLDYGKFLKALYIIRMPREKIYFTHKEVADALLKIKTNSKK